MYGYLVFSINCTMEFIMLLSFFKYSRYKCFQIKLQIVFCLNFVHLLVYLLIIVEHLNVFTYTLIYQVNVSHGDMRRLVVHTTWLRGGSNHIDYVLFLNHLRSSKTFFFNCYEKNIILFLWWHQLHNVRFLYTQCRIKPRITFALI